MAAGVPTYVPGFHDADAVARMKYNPLGSTGCMVSALSFGGSALGAVFGAISQEQCVEVLRLAIRLGVNLCECAAAAPIICWCALPSCALPHCSRGALGASCSCRSWLSCSGYGTLVRPRS
jgi:hypothetical protein